RMRDGPAAAVWYFAANRGNSLLDSVPFDRDSWTAVLEFSMGRVIARSRFPGVLRRRSLAHVGLSVSTFSIDVRIGNCQTALARSELASFACAALSFHDPAVAEPDCVLRVSSARMAAR